MQQELAKSALTVQTTLLNAGLECKVLEFSSSTRTAQEAADAVGCVVSQIVKSLIFKTAHTQQPVLLLVSGSNRVDEKLVSALVGEPIGKASAEFVREVTGFAIGGVPPCGHATPIELIFIDQDLLVFEQVWAAAGTPHAVFCIATKDLIAVSGARPVALAL